jgi:hypothetical protein
MEHCISTFTGFIDAALAENVIRADERPGRAGR